MTTPVIDPTFQPGRSVFGYTLPGMGSFGNARTYPQKAIFGARSFGSQVCGLDIEEEIFKYRFGAPVPREKGPWPVTPDMGARFRGAWAKRIIFYTRGGQQRTMRYSPYHGSAKEHLVPWQLKLMEASFLWSLLDDETKARLAADAKSTGQATQGHNFFTKLYIKDDPRWMDYM